MVQMTFKHLYSILYLYCRSKTKLILTPYPLLQNKVTIEFLCIYNQFCKLYWQS